MKQAAALGDTVMTPTNVQALVIEVYGAGKYDQVLVRENTVDQWTKVWDQRQLIVQREARWDAQKSLAKVVDCRTCGGDGFIDGEGVCPVCQGRAHTVEAR